MPEAGVRGHREQENLATIAERGCIVANTIREAVVLEIQVKESQHCCHYAC